MSLDVGALYEQHAAQVAGFVRKRMTGAAEGDADDVAQLVWERALRASGRYRPDSHPLAWLFTIARNAVTDYYRRHEWRQRARSVPAATLLDEHHPARRDRYPSDTAHVRRAVVELPPDQRAAVVLRFWDGLQSPQIAAALGCSDNGIKKRHQRAFVQLRKRLEGAA